MANGGWYGTQEEWVRLEAPLLELDPVIAAFADEHSLALSKNHKDWPERSIRWGANPSCLIQLYLADSNLVLWHLWLCCAEDRGSERFWRQDRLVDGQQMPDFGPHIRNLLDEGRRRLERWRAAPEELEFATRISAVP
ncbi:MAG TPA: hypothetical protein VGN74_03540 [Brevundimonas sp.]|uniref:hypothetical protein n=1 Tax=Brevundimonas sp. TaxID=1871086 RepID=UPI002E0E017E|nr:hypothetical protein [Brevundimonas sp.]